MTKLRKQVELVCDECGSSYNKDLSEYNRNTKLNRKSYCSQKCAGKQGCNHLIPYQGQGEIRKYAKVQDEFSPFRRYISVSKRRGKEFTITVEHLKKVWDQQNGICPYSGIKMIHGHYLSKSDPLLTASLDRINSSIGYIEGNVQFVVLTINLMKGSMTHEQTIELCKQIAKYHER